jgi:hypothetical protein
VLFGALVSGALSALPIVAAGNLCCCLWVVIGGVVAAYVLQQRQSTPITLGDAAVVGLLAGLAGAVVYIIIAVPINILIAPIEREMVTRMMDRLGDVPPQFREYANRSGAMSVAFTIIDFVMRLLLGALFSTLGGLLGAAIFAKKPPPAAPPTVIDVPPPGF